MHVSIVSCTRNDLSVTGLGRAHFHSVQVCSLTNHLPHKVEVRDKTKWNLLGVRPQSRLDYIFPVLYCIYFISQPWSSDQMISLKLRISIRLGSKGISLMIWSHVTETNGAFLYIYKIVALMKYFKWMRATLSWNRKLIVPCFPPSTSSGHKQILTPQAWLQLICSPFP